MSGNKHPVKLSVRQLVEFAAIRGDLSLDDAQGPGALEGIEGHKQVQAQRSDAWQKETAVKHEFEIGEFRLTLSGRIDLLKDTYCSDDAKIIIEEIKTSYQPASAIHEDKKHLHRAQAWVYAYLYLLTNKRAEDALVTVTYFNLKKNTIESEQQSLSFVELEHDTLNLITLYLAWYKRYHDQLQATQSTAKTLEFPFDTFRDGQRLFARFNYRAIRDKHHALIEAPTGTGKTISVLFSAFKAQGEGLVSQSLYLTAKVSGQKAAVDTINLLCEHELNTNYMVIQAKDKSCPCRSENSLISQSCRHESGKCSRTIGFYDRLAEARIACFEAKHLTPDVLEEICDTHHLCPFAVSMHMTRWVNMVICDYNYVFDPLVQLAVFAEKPASRSVVADEVHNLPERARAMYSASLSALDAKQIAKRIDPAYHTLKKSINTLAKAIDELDTGSVFLTEPPEKIDQIVDQLMRTLAEVDPYSLSLVSQGDIFQKHAASFPQWLKQLYRYLTIRLLYSENHVCMVKKEFSQRRSHNTIALVCLDASDYLAKNYRNARHFTGISATINPPGFYLDSLGLDRETPCLQLPATFNPANQCTLRCDYIDTRWQQRTHSIKPISLLLAQVFQCKPGKYIIFFPSYQYMQDVYEYFSENIEFDKSIPIFIQQQGSSEEDKKTFLDNFFASEQGCIGFAITGGIYGEAVDFKGRALDGVLIVGTGMPSPSPIQKRIEALYQSKGFNAHQYAYQFPGFTRVQQAAGRVIRSESDRGIVILIDARFSRMDYQQIMPRHWQQIACTDESSVVENLNTFWGAI